MIKLTPFFASCYQHTKNNFKNLTPEAIKKVEDLDAMREEIRENIYAAQIQMAKYYNQRVANKEPQFKMGDCMIVNSKNIKTKKPYKKLDYKLRDKFEIEMLCTINTYKLKLHPLSSKLNPLFYINLLKPSCQNTIPARHSPTLPLVDLEQQKLMIKKINTTEN